MKRALPWLFVFAAFSSIASSGPGDSRSSAPTQGFESIPGVQLESLDLQRIEIEDAQFDFKARDGGWRFAIARDGVWTPDNSGAWTANPDGGLTWRLRVSAANAAHLNFGFRRFQLPPGAALTISRPDGAQTLGPYTAADHVRTGQLWTPLLMGASALIQLDVPDASVDQVQLELQRIAQGYRGFGARPSAAKSGSCNMDVTCLGSKDAWNEPVGAVGAFTVGGVDFCTGSLVNNTNGDRRMLFATARHCELSPGNVATMLVYWRYENPTCRQPGSGASGQAIPKPSTTSPGIAFLAGTNNPFGGGGASGTRSDWNLVELGEPNAKGLGLFWAGWDRRGSETDVVQCLSPPLAGDPSSTVGLCASIHHPNVDEKRITFLDRNLTVGDIASASGVHWFTPWAGSTPGNSPPVLPNLPNQVGPVARGVTEPGSSGSPLYSAQRRLIGVLSGGASFCGATGTNLSDLYGALFHAYEGAGLGACNTSPPLSTTCMRPYLDPAGNNPEFIDGIGEGTVNPDQIFADGFE
jgi:hypothetical protein